MRPMQVKKPAVTENRISPGRVVEYLQHGKPYLAVVLASKRDKWSLVNQDGGELEAAADRLELLPASVPETATTKDQKAAFLKQLLQEAAALKASINLEDAWSLVHEEKDECTLGDLTELLFGAPQVERVIAAKQLLAEDVVYFKRKKTGTFEPRPPETVAELKHQAAVERKRQARLTELARAIAARVADPNSPLPDSIEQMEAVAALGKAAPNAKDVLQVADAVVELTGLQLPNAPHEKLFDLLCRMHHFTIHENLVPFRMGRPTAFTAEEQAESNLHEPNTPNRVDRRNLVTFTIDGADTKDFDDAISIESIGSSFDVGIHISDVAASIISDSELELAALRRASSIYCPDQVLPMLPRNVCEDLLSLRESTVRPVMSFYLSVDEEFSIIGRRIERSTITIAKRLSYEDADRMLCEEQVDASPLHQSLRTLWEIALASEQRRMENGATTFSRREMTPVVDDHGQVTLINYDEDTPSRKLVSELMVLANETGAEYARAKGFPLIFRSQEPPDVDISEQGQQVAEGPARDFYIRSLLKRSLVNTTPGYHYGLGLNAYAQLTSPLRRATDLLNQRQLASYLDTGKPFYSDEQMTEKLSLLATGLDEASTISKERTRYWLMQYLQQQRIRELTGTVMKLDGPRPLAEIDELRTFFTFQTKDQTARGKLRLGDRVKIRVEAINPRKDSMTLLLAE